VTFKVLVTPAKDQKPLYAIGANEVVVHMSKISAAAPPCRLLRRLQNFGATVNSYVVVAFGVAVAEISLRWSLQSSMSKPSDGHSAYFSWEIGLWG
jgi:hypothetical protein